MVLQRRGFGHHTVIMQVSEGYTVEWSVVEFCGVLGECGGVHLGRADTGDGFGIGEHVEVED